ncbi:piggyBac transposable element-derived protein 2-like [Ixodes scapularis]
MPDKCCVPRCNGNYKTGPKVHVFGLPKDEALRSAWINAIPRENLIVSQRTKVCERHFSDDDVLREVSHVDEVTGRTVTAPLSRSAAIKNADVVFFLKTFCRLSEALEAALDVFQDANEDVDVVIIPPDPSPDTGEEERDNDATSSIQVNDVSGILEAHCQANEKDADNQPWRAKRAKVTNSGWMSSSPEYTWTSSTNGAEQREEKLKSDFLGKSPNEIISTILDEDILTHIVIQTGTYAKQKNEHSFAPSLDDLRKFISILVLSGYHKLPSQRLY